MTAPAPRLSTLLVLGRTSNLPTVWSNCLAGWLLNGGGTVPGFLLLCGGAAFLYVGGMFLNDAFDAGFDREFRPERPIPAGEIAVRDVWWFGGLMLFIGWTLLFLIGNAAALWALALVAAILGYNAVHKHTAAAPLLMALCRFLLYAVAGAAAAGPLPELLLWHGLALAAYIIGLSYLALGESRRGKFSLTPLVFCFVPLLIKALVHPPEQLPSWLACAALSGWLLAILIKLRRHPEPARKRTVAALLAGIVLVDCIAVPELSFSLLPAFAGLFGLTLLKQRFIPAT